MLAFVKRIYRITAFVNFIRLFDLILNIVYLTADPMANKKKITSLHQNMEHMKTTGRFIQFFFLPEFKMTFWKA